jgi:hypothetical protein
MSADHETLAEKRRRLAADIARQRTQLAGAYRDIAKPILYTEYGLRGMGFLRSNPWILTIVPASLSTTTSVLAIVRALTSGKPLPKKAKWFGSAKRDAERDAERAAERDVKRVKKSVLDHALKWSGHGWKAYRIYRRIRKYLP